MKKACLIAVRSLTGLFGRGVSAPAQDVDSVVVTVPFEFGAGGATLSAGEYRAGRVNPSVNRELAISGDNTGSAFLLLLAFHDGPTKKPMLSFEHVGQVLSEQDQNTGRRLCDGGLREMIMLGQANTPGPSASSSSACSPEMRRLQRKSTTLTVRAHQAR
jgi:hypothetical protein